MYDVISSAARKAGFAAVYFTGLPVLSTWREASAAIAPCAGLPFDLPAALPGARAVILLVYAYSPFPNGDRISPFYLASNRAYFASKALAAELSSMGIGAKRVEIPLRALALASGIGSACKNGLLSIKPFGTRIVLEALASDAVAPLAVSLPDPCPKNCDICAAACPANAISGGFAASRCMRLYMGTALHPEYIRRVQQTYMGCEICQDVCPKNASLPRLEPTEDERAAFDLRRLISGCDRDARVLAGKNVTARGKLCAEAIAFAAREGLYKDEIRAALSSPHEAVREAALWALNTYFIE